MVSPIRAISMSDQLFDRAEVPLFAAEPAFQGEPSIAHLAHIAASLASTTPASPANDNDQDWLRSLSQSYPTIASREEHTGELWCGLMVVGIVFVCVAVGWGYVLAQSFSGLESLLN